MKANKGLAEWAAICSMVVVVESGWSQLTFIPERFGVIDLTPNSFSGETLGNAEPSLGVGLNAKYGKAVVHAFSGNPNYYYASPNFATAPWASPGNVRDNDATLDWSAGGTCYLATLPVFCQIQVLKSPDPGTTAFAPIDTITKGVFPYFPDQPWIRVVQVHGVDHIYVGYNDLSRQSENGGDGKTPTVRYSLNGGGTWSETGIEKTGTSVGWDSPAVRLAISSDGLTVYALFQRNTNWLGEAFASDYNGEVVLMRDDNSGLNSFNALGAGGAGTKVAGGIVLPWFTTSLPANRLFNSCDVAMKPTERATVYVAYTEVLGGSPVLRVSKSVNSGASFSLAYSITNAALPALAVASDDTVGMLYLAQYYTDLEVHFLKAFSGSFAPSDIVDRKLSKFPWSGTDRWVGDYFQIRAVSYDFFGTFAALADPQPSQFPSGVYFQRNVNVGGVIKNNFWLSRPGELVDLSGTHVDPSIDPFVFYDYGPTFTYYLYFRPPPFYDPGDPYYGIAHFSWPVLPATEPQLLLYTSPTIGPGANWTPVSNNGIIQTNGQNLAALSGTEGQQYYRLQQNVASGQFGVFAAAGANGSISPSGILTNAGLTSRTFTATPSNNFAVSKWYLDGVVVQSNSASLKLSNISREHTLVATFVASNDLAVAEAEFSGRDGPTETYTTNSYLIGIENKGLTTLTGIWMTNVLDSTVGFVSASASQGSVNYFSGRVTANIGSLNPGSAATVSIQFIPFLATNIVDAVSVACDQSEPDLSNNLATDYTTVIDPVIITNQPASVIAPSGGNAAFTVGVKGTPPFTYQWFFNATNLINDATNASLILTNLTSAQSGAYSVSVLQILGPEEVEGETSDSATLLVQ
jgi:uncharacterized repeat protein (TIGR01451 family)